MEDTWDGIYVKALDTEYDLNQDGQPDVCFVKKIPVQTKPVSCITCCRLQCV